MSDIEKLRVHPAARFRDARPPLTTLQKYVACFTGPTGLVHWLWKEWKGIRWHDKGHQAVYRWKHHTYNVARVFLEERPDRRSRLVRAVNSCGLTECVNPQHWSDVAAFAGVVESQAETLSTAQVAGVWRLYQRGTLVSKDMAFVAGGHAIRALYEANETLFVSACGKTMNPAMIAAGGVVTCEGCLS